MASHNPLQTYWKNKADGPGLWKWDHYLDLYHTHLEKFVGQKPNLLEIGIYSGGSLEMWRRYFGRGCSIYGVDIEPNCRAYESEDIVVHIGDQGDASFWTDVKKTTPFLDIVIDDGGHRPEQQLTTFESLISHMSPGGVYICEDIHGTNNMFALFLHNFSLQLNDSHRLSVNKTNSERRLSTPTNRIQERICSISFYPYAAVIEVNKEDLKELRAPKRGTDWQPHLE